jgi:hypothetical protein
MDGMGILDNFENVWNPGMQYESTPIKLINNAGEPSLAAKLFSETCCDGCGCKTSTDHNIDFVQDVIDFEQ